MTAEEVSKVVKEKRRRIGQAIHPVEDAAVAGYGIAGILDTEVTLE
jgi:hypothetical protein